MGKPKIIDPVMKFKSFAVTCVLIAAAAGMLMSWPQKRGTVGSKQSEVPTDEAILQATPPAAASTVHSETLQDRSVDQALALPTPVPAVQGTQGSCTC